MFYKVSMESFSGEDGNEPGMLCDGHMVLRYLPRWPWSWLGWKPKRISWGAQNGMWRDQNSGRAATIEEQFWLDDIWERRKWLLKKEQS